MANKKFNLTLENFGEIVEQIESELSKTKATRKESMNAQLLLEETFMRLVNIGKAESVSVEISQRFGDLNLRLESEGIEYNPLIAVTDFDEEDEDYFRTIILKANAAKMNYTRKENKNLVFIQVHSSGNRQVYYTIIGMVAGIILGLMLKFFATPEMISMFSQNISNPIQTMIMNAMTMMIAPLVFFSIISSLTGLTNSINIGRIGGKLIVLYSITAFIAIAINYISAEIIFSSSVPHIGVVEKGTAAINDFSFLSAIINIIPINMVSPIIDCNLLQVIFIAILFGLCINKLGDKVKLLSEFVAEANNFCLTLITAITEFIPLITFLLMADMFTTLGTDSIMLLGRLLMCVIVSAVVLVLVYSLAILTICKISPLPLLKKLPSFMTIPFSTCSSMISMPFTLKFCTSKLGISPQLAAFSVPIGSTTNTNGVPLFYAAACLMVLKMYGIEIDNNTIFAFFFAIFTFSIAMPGMAGGDEIFIAAILGMFGVPATAVAILFGIIPIQDRIVTCTNVFGVIGVSMIIAENENLLDKDVYSKM